MDIIISINKPRGITSQGAVTKVKKIVQVKKAGHTGTLDPLASGLLLICINRATRLASYFTDLDKEYRAVMKLGETTDTQDAQGTVVEIRSTDNVTRESVEKVLRDFEGDLLQQPPMYSALKHKGRSLYTYARKGIDIERAPRKIIVKAMEMTDFALPFASFRTVCSKGTYVRTICHDIGSTLGVGAHLYELERTAIGPFTLNGSLTFDEVKAVMEGEEIRKGIYSMDEALSWLPEFRLDETLIKPVMHGSPVQLHRMEISEDVKTAKGIRIKSPDGTLLAIGSYVAPLHIIKLDRVFT